MEGIRIFFQRPFDYQYAREYSGAIMTPTLWVTAAYVTLVFGTKAYMKDKKPFDLRRPLQIWNLSLALYSGAAFLIATKEILTTWFNKGLAATYTDIDSFYNGTCGAWAYLFMLSKYYELGDTAFLVLRKRPLMLMHWLHHLTTLNLVLAGYHYDTHLYSWLLWMNTFIHTLMYSYYLLASCGYRLPAGFAKKITTMQIIQFCIGLSILAYIGVLKLFTNSETHCNWRMWWGTVFMEILYLTLFSHFYYVSYIKDGGKKFVRDQNEKKMEKAQ
ncbi:unnamed protein product [Bursaphelenchus okinawaensis]|uniref:Elongation of very long chain fatty acids protein n=1 Tax=Bursaphelenchus okinawaensis TaxID=465554 RepID=A0A811KD21_9BILA|nr:unnamed protein product [Bursaphelenchus okinawaensis]CAG9099248.1 unnamed protein product [Bursaphelenchus okinawaensis]